MWVSAFSRLRGLLVLDFPPERTNAPVPVVRVVVVVQGRDYINPAIKPIFDKISREVWREATKL
jgi:hypothetical protein